MIFWNYKSPSIVSLFTRLKTDDKIDGSDRIDVDRIDGGESVKYVLTYYINKFYSNTPNIGHNVLF